MDVKLKDGRIIQFPEGTSDEDALDYIKANYPEPPTIPERFVGHLFTGLGGATEKLINLAGYFTDVKESREELKEAVKASPFTESVKQFPETSFLGQAGAGLVHFLPQLPLYIAGERAGLGVMSKIPHLAKVAHSLRAVKGEGIVKGTGRAIGRAAIGGAIIGTAIGTPAESSIEEKLTEGGKEAAMTAAAVAVLHPAFASLGYIGRGIFRRMREKATLKKVEAELSKRAETDPVAAEELQRFKEAEVAATKKTVVETKADLEAKEGELFVPKGEKEVLRTKDIQGVLELDEIAGPEQLARFKELGYVEDDLIGLPDATKLLILEQGIKKSSVVEKPKVEVDEIAKVEKVDVDEKPKRRGKESKKIEEEQDQFVNVKVRIADYIKRHPEKDIWFHGGGSPEERIKEYGFFTKDLDDAIDYARGSDRRGKKGEAFIYVVDRKKVKLGGDPITPYLLEPGRYERVFDIRSGPLLPKKEVVVPPSSGKKITIASADIEELQRMGYRITEIRKMSAKEAKDTIERVKNIPEPTIKEIARAEEAAAKIQEAFLARKGEKDKIQDASFTRKGEKDKSTINKDSEMTEEQNTKFLEDIDKEIADEPLSPSVDTLLKAQRVFDDPTLDSLIEKAPKTREEIMELFRQRVRDKATKVEPIEKTKTEKKKPPQTEQELRKHLAEVRAKARRERKIIDYAEEAEKWEANLRKEGDEIYSDDIPSTKETFVEHELYMNPIEPIYNWIKKLVVAKKTKNESPSNKLVAEISGSTLTTRIGSEQVDSTLAHIIANISRFSRTKLETPSFAYEGDPFRATKKPGYAEVSDYIFQLHKAVYEGKFAASKSNEVVAVSRSLLSTPESRVQMRGIIEKTITTTDPVMLRASDLLIKEHNAVKELYKDYLRKEMRENMNEDMFAALSEIISGRSEMEVIAKYKQRIVPDKLGRQRVRNWIDDETLLDTVKEYKEIDNWGLENYVTRYERGPIRIVSEGKLYAKAMSTEDAAQKFIGLVERDRAEGIQRNYQIDTNYNVEPLATGLSKQSYNRMITNLQKGIESSIEGINSSVARRLAQKGVKDRFFISPTKKYSPFVETRKDLLRGEEDIYDILPFYFYSMHMKMALDPVISNVKKATNKVDVIGTESYKAKDGTIKEREIKRPHLNKEMNDYLIRYIEDIKGREYLGDKIVDNIFQGIGGQRKYSKFVQGSRELQANLKLSYAPIKGGINGVSAVGYLWTKAGSANIAKAIKFMGTPEGKAFTDATDKYLGVNIVEAATGEISARGTFEKLGWLKPPKTELSKLSHAAIEPLGWFQLPELPARRLSMATGYLMGKASGLSDEAARNVAIKFTHFTQFAYDIASLPELLRSPTGRLIGQFKPFMMKSIEFMTTLRGDEWARFMAMQMALAGPRGALILVKSLPIIGLVGGWSKLEEWMNKEYPRLSRGLAGFAGIDISASAAFELPSKPRDWFGPTLSNIGSLYKNVYEPLVSGKGIDGSDISKFTGETFPIYRYWAKIVEQVVDRDGWVKDERGRRLYHIDNTAAFVTKNILGAQTIEESRIKIAERIHTKRKFDATEQKIDTVDNILDAIKKGNSIDPTDIENMVKLGIKPSTLRRAAKFRALDPKTRRLLMTEIIRRPEIIEKYPDVGDFR